MYPDDDLGQAHSIDHIFENGLGRPEVSTLIAQSDHIHLLSAGGQFVRWVFSVIVKAGSMEVKNP